MSDTKLGFDTKRNTVWITRPDRKIELTFKGTSYRWRDSNGLKDRGDLKKLITTLDITNEEYLYFNARI
jgi:hypothetical protein